MHKIAAKLAALLLAGTLVCGDGIAAQQRSEESLRAAFLVSLVRFSEWPDKGEGTVTIGIAGNADLEAALQSILTSKAVGGRTIETRSVKSPAEARQCQVLFLGETRGKKSEELLQAAKGLPVLTITANPSLYDNGAIVLLFEEDGKLRFEVDWDAMAQSRLMISSKLLKLGTIRKSGAKVRP